MTAISPSPTLAPLALRAPSVRSARLALIALCLFSALLGRFCFLLRPFDNDAAIFIYMGKMVATGGRLCHDLIDNKFPTVGLMTSLLWRTFGTCWPAYIALQTILSLASAWMLGRAAARVAGPQAQLPTTLFMMVFLNVTTAVFGGFQLETVQVFFTVIAASSALRILDSPGRKAGDRTASGAVRRSIPGLAAWLFHTSLVFAGDSGNDAEGERRTEKKFERQARQCSNGSPRLRSFSASLREILSAVERGEQRGLRAWAITEDLEAAFLTGLAAGCGMMLKPTAIGVLAAMIAGLFFKRDIMRRGATVARDPRAAQKGIPATRSAGPCGPGKSLGNQDLPTFECRTHGPEDRVTMGIFSMRLPWALVLSMMSGLAIPTLCVLLYLNQANLFADMPGLYRQISTYARESVFDVVELIKPLAALLLLGFPMTIRGLVCRRQREADMRWPIPPVIAFAIAWLLIETIGVILQRRMYAYHFLPMVPPAALLFGFIPRLNRPGALAAALLPIALLSVNQACDLIATIRPGESPMPISRYLIAHAKPGDAVWMDAWPRVVLETGLRPASRLPFTFLFTNYDTAGLDYSAGMIADFERTRPAYIILPVPLDRRMQYQIDFIPELNRRPIRQSNYIAGWRRIERYTLDHYVRETIIGNDVVYRLKS